MSHSQAFRFLVAATRFCGAGVQAFTHREKQAIQ